MFHINKGAFTRSSLIMGGKVLWSGLSTIFYLKVLWRFRYPEINEGTKGSHVGFVTGLTDSGDAQLYVASLLNK